MGLMVHIERIEEPKHLFVNQLRLVGAENVTGAGNPHKLSARNPARHSQAVFHWQQPVFITMHDQGGYLYSGQTPVGIPSEDRSELA